MPKHPPRRPKRRAPVEGGLELEWIDWIRRTEASAAQGHPARVPVGIGDDAAVWTPARGSSVVLTVDAQVEGVHFRRGWLSLAGAGERAVSASVSDLAAMAARPVGILVALTAPQGFATRELRALHRGILAGARRYGLRLLGGNLSSGALAISVTAVGEGKPHDLVRRDGARPGDILWVTGSPGMARLGCLALERGVRGGGAGLPSRALRAFLRPTARVKEARDIARGWRPTAMIDLSDGVAADLGHVFRESTRRAGAPVGADIDEAAALGLPGLLSCAQVLGEEPVETALRGGEDYELCFMTRGRAAPEDLRGAFEARHGVTVTALGRITDRPGIRLLCRDGRSMPVRARGWDHFARARITRRRRSTGTA